MKSILFLDTVLTTKIVTFLYWILLVADWVAAAYYFNLGGENNFMIGLALLIFGSIVVRLWAEFWVVIFKVQQNTRLTAQLLNDIYQKQCELQEEQSKENSSPSIQ